ncbi:MAG: VCBS repeat-containing protein [Nannocystaceae bacterium]|nr:VCBS repeat-containing protein [Nannocystaceae bacterium]
MISRVCVVSLVSIAACFSPDTGAVGTDTEAGTGSTGLSATTQDPTATSATMPTTGGVTTDPTADTTDASTSETNPTVGPADSTGDEASTGEDESTDGTTGTPTECDNGVAEPGELCLGEVELFEPVNPTEKIATADMDNNGNLDLITSEGDDSEAAFHFGTGMGGFGGTAGDAFGPETTDVAIGFFNSDAFPDVVFGLASANNNVGVMLGDGAGTFALPLDTSGSIAAATAVAVGDMNGNGFDDIVAVGSTAPSGGPEGRIMTFFAAGSGSGVFGAPVSTAHPDGVYYDVVLGDFNGNSVLDAAFVFSGGANTTIRVCNGNNTGSFPNAACETLDGGNSPRALAVGDFDGDGNDDLAVSQSTANEILIHRGLGNGTFAAVDVIVTTETSWGLAAGDLDNDGIDDLVATHPAPATASIILGNSDGTFEINATLSMDAAGYVPQDVVLGDFNEDGALDVALGCGGFVGGDPAIGVFNSAI